jgi:hypothetical protein
MKIVDDDHEIEQIVWEYWMAMEKMMVYFDLPFLPAPSVNNLFLPCCIMEIEGHFANG